MIPSDGLSRLGPEVLYSSVPTAVMVTCTLIVGLWDVSAPTATKSGFLELYRKPEPPRPGTEEVGRSATGRAETSGITTPLGTQEKGDAKTLMQNAERKMKDYTERQPSFSKAGFSQRPATVKASDYGVGAKMRGGCAHILNLNLNGVFLCSDESKTESGAS